jgi:hypothetical protein
MSPAFMNMVDKLVNCILQNVSGTQSVNGTDYVEMVLGCKGVSSSTFCFEQTPDEPSVAPILQYLTCVI